MYNNDAQKKCGFCGETIPTSAGRCPYCGSLLEVTFDNVYDSNRPDQPANQGAASFFGEPVDQGAGPIRGKPAGMNDEQNPEQNAGAWNNSGNTDIPDAEQGSESAGNEGQPRTSDAQEWNQPQTQTHGTPEINQPQPQTPVPAQSWNQTQQGAQGQWQNPGRPVQDYQRPYYQNRPQQAPRYDKPALSNGLKVFLTILFTVIPGIGQLAGIITAIVFMSADGDKDRKSFGVALLVACLILFLLSCIGCFALSLISTSMPFRYGNNW